MHEQLHQEHVETIRQGSSVQQSQSQIDCTDGLCRKTLIVNQQPQQPHRPEVVVVTNSLQAARKRLALYLLGLGGEKTIVKVSPGSGMLAATAQPTPWTPTQLVLMLAIVPSIVGALALFALWSFSCCFSENPETEHPLRALGEPLVPAENAGMDLELAQGTAIATVAQVGKTPEKDVGAAKAVSTYLLSVYASAEAKAMARATSAYIRTLYARA